jgi:SAM-dependent methyltransferase
MTTVNYDTLAAHYDDRYATRGLPAVAALLREVAEPLSQARPAARALEVGCGTGHWLGLLRQWRPVVGLDRSQGMLRRAQAGAAAGLPLAQASAEGLPVAAGCFDLVLVVNALHHFGQQAAFVAEARRVLRPGGVLVMIGMDPHQGRDRWYIYDYYPGTRETDLARFPSAGQQLDWLAAAGFTRAEWRQAAHTRETYAGRAVLASHFGQKYGTSQLALLSDAAYQAGRKRLEADIAAAEGRGETIVCEFDVRLYAVIGWV